VQRRQSGFSQARLLNFQSTCIGHTSQWSWVVAIFTAVGDWISKMRGPQQ
jgi:hypothetical protein